MNRTSTTLSYLYLIKVIIALLALATAILGFQLADAKAQIKEIKAADKEYRHEMNEAIYYTAKAALHIQESMQWPKDTTFLIKRDQFLDSAKIHFNKANR
jgi:hypothetical protein